MALVLGFSVCLREGVGVFLPPLNHASSAGGWHVFRVGVHISPITRRGTTGAELVFEDPILTPTPTPDLL